MNLAELAVTVAALTERLERLERPVDARDAIAWEIGHAAALRGDSLASNPFRKPLPQAERPGNR